MPANPINLETYRRVIRMNVDGTRHRRYSLDAARKRFYAASRQRRYSRYLDSLAK